MKGKQTRVVIVGGGFGGVKTALCLANDERFQVQLISGNTHFEYHGALYRSAVGHSPKEVVIPLSSIFEDKNVDVVLDSIAYIDSKKKVLVSLDGNTYPYDKVVFALGNVVNYFDIPGLKEHCESMSTIRETIKLRRKLIELFSVKQTKPARIAIIGGGASGVELAAELPEFINLIARRHKLPRPKAKIILVEGSNRVLPNLKPSASAKALKRLVKLGVEVHLNIKVESCEQNNLCLSAGSLAADILVWTAGSKPVSFYETNPEVFTLSRSGRVVVDEHLSVQGAQDIYVIGDNADTKYSGMAQTALYDARFIAENFKRAKSRKKLRTYKPKPPLYVVAVGGKWAVAQKGGRVLSGVRGWRIRRQADLTIFKNFEPYKQAIKTWKAGNNMSKF